MEVVKPCRRSKPWEAKTWGRSKLKARLNLEEVDTTGKLKEGVMLKTMRLYQW